MEMYMGMVVLFSRGGAPSELLPCDGRTLGIAEHAGLYAVIGNKFGGDHNTFALPNLTAPDPELAYYMCVQGMFPPRQ